MLRIHQSSSVTAAKSYYGIGLVRGDYYAGETQPGLWFGRAADMLGLNGGVGRNDFHALCDNLRPDTGEKLNPRTNTARTVGYDMTFSAPKSVSVLHGVHGDDRITDVFQKAVRETMRHIQADAMVRVRRNGRIEDRVTGNLVWAEFTHTTSRPVDGLCDPNLHIHNYCFNTSHDPVENRFKAGKFLRIKQNAPYYQAVFHSRLAGGLKRLGYNITNRPLGFEVAGISREMIELFSRRTAQIEAMADKLGIAGDKKAMSELGALTRSGKNKGMSRREMRREWRRRARSLGKSDGRAEMPGSHIDAGSAVAKAIATCFERRSVVSNSRLVAEALQISLGSCGLEEIQKAFKQRDDLILVEKEKGLLATTKEVLGEEKQVLGFLEKTRRSTYKMNKAYCVPGSLLDGDQRQTVEALMKSPDRVFVIQGGAGTGKTTLMREAVRAMESTGEKVFTFAPTSEAAHVVLKSEGFSRSETIQQFLLNTRLQEEARHGVLWIDEAGLLSVREMRQLFDIAEHHGNRIILSGDTRQHASVERGDALRLVAGSGFVTVKQTQKIHRQKSARYRKAVGHLSRGETGAGFFILESMGAIHEYEDLADKLRKLTEDYLQSSERFDHVLLVSPTHFEGGLVTRQIRETLKQRGKLGKEELAVPVDRNRHLTRAEKQLPYFYEAGQIVRFQRAVPGQYRRGERLIVRKISGDIIFVGKENEDKLRKLDPNLSSHFDLMRRENIPVAAGDRIRLLKNIVTPAGKRLYNGSVHKVEGWNEEQIVLEGGHGIDRHAGIVDYGYVSTSHASQGRTAGKVILSQSGHIRGASSLEQFYVSVSRGRFEVSVYTDNREELLESVRHGGQRQLGVELAGESNLKEALMEEESLRQSRLFLEQVTAPEVK